MSHIFSPKVSPWKQDNLARVIHLPAVEVTFFTSEVALGCLCLTSRAMSIVAH